jgi:hypothetical protein
LSEILEALIGCWQFAMWITSSRALHVDDRRLCAYLPSSR